MRKRKPHPPPSRSAPTIALCVIARDEEERIATCLDSARPFVDEVVVVDTGSADGTVELARARGARVELFPWCDDFAAARNAAIGAARADWILMLDADEELEAESGPVLRRLVAEAPASLHCYTPPIRSVVNPERPDGYVTSFHARLFRRLPDLRFAGAIHEDLRYRGGAEPVRGALAAELRIRHSGYLKEHYATRAKDARNTRLLAQQLAQRPDDPLLHFYMGQQHAAMERHAEAVASFRASLRCGLARTSFLVDLYMLLINSLIASGSTGQLAAVEQEAEAANALSSKARELLADHAMRVGQYARAERHLLKALSGGQHEGILRYPGAGGWGTRVLLARLYEQLGNARGALAQLEQALDDPEAPDRAQLARDAAQLAARLGDSETTQRWFAYSAQHTPEDVESHYLLAAARARALSGLLVADQLERLPALERAVLAGDWQAAYDAALAAPAGDAASAARALFVAGRLYQQGAPDAALDLLEPLLDAAPTSTRLYWLLVRVLADLGRHDDALRAVEVLRHLPGGDRVPLAA